MIGAPLSIAWLAWAWRSQCTETAGLTPARSAAALTVNTYVAAVKSFLGFAHRVGFTRFNAARPSSN